MSLHLEGEDVHRCEATEFSFLDIIAFWILDVLLNSFNSKSVKPLFIRTLIEEGKERE